MIRGVVLGVLLLTLCTGEAKKSDLPVILEESLDEFLDRMTHDDEDDRIEFRGYYSAFLEKQARRRRNGKQRYLNRLRYSALHVIETEHPAWYKELEPYLFDLEDQTYEARRARLFLTRFALFQEYLRTKNPEKMGWFDTIRSYGKGFKETVSAFKDRMLGRPKRVRR